MASGLDHRSDPTGHPIYGAADRFQFALAPALVHAPGRRYNYSDGDASIAGAVAAAAAGKDLLGYGNEVLFGPLGFKNVEWWFRDKAGRYPGGWGLRLRAVDMARFGQLYLQNGRWQDRTIIDAGFVRDAWRASPAASHYGLFWWRWPREDPRIGPVHFANGLKGQRVYALPKHGIIIVVRKGLPRAGPRSGFGRAERPTDQSISLRCQQACRTAPPAILRQAREPGIANRARCPAASKIGPRSL